MGSLSGRLLRLEQRTRRRSFAGPPPSPTEIEARALNEEIGALEREMEARGEDPGEGLREALVDLPLEKEIAAIEEELERCQEV